MFVLCVAFFFSKKFFLKKIFFQKVVFFSRIIFFFRRFSLLHSTRWIGSSWKKCHTKLSIAETLYHTAVYIERGTLKKTDIACRKQACNSPAAVYFFHKIVFQQVSSMFLWRNIIWSTCFLFLKIFSFSRFFQLITTLLRIDSWRTDDQAKCNDFTVSSASITMFPTSLSVSLYATHTRTSPPNSIHRHVLQTFALPWPVIAFTSRRTVHVCRKRDLIDRIELTLCASLELRADCSVSRRKLYRHNEKWNRDDTFAQSKHTILGLEPCNKGWETRLQCLTNNSHNHVILQRCKAVVSLNQHVALWVSV